MGRNTTTTTTTAVIADSDDESDGDVQLLCSQSKFPPALRDGKVPDQDLGVNFNEFLTNSQQCDGGTIPGVQLLEESQGESGKGTDTKANRRRQIEREQQKLAKDESIESRGSLFREAPSSSPTMATTKRSHSMLVDGAQMDGARETSRKRQKTYGGSGSNRSRLGQCDAFVDQHWDQGHEMLTNPAVGHDLDYPSDLKRQDPGAVVESAVAAGEGHWQGVHNHPNSSRVHLGFPNEHDFYAQDYGCGDGLPDALSDSMNMSAAHVSKSRSLMGNHESLHLDFGANGTGLDIHANPFGDPSQQSVDDRDDGTDQDKLQAIFQPLSCQTANDGPVASDRDMCSNLSAESQLSTVVEADQDSTSCERRNLGRSKSFVDPGLRVDDHAQDPREFPCPKSASSCKRRKTDNGLPRAIASEAKAIDVAQSTTTTREQSPPGTEKQIKKRGRKPKISGVSKEQDAEDEQQARDTNENIIAPEAESPPKNPSSDLHLDEESTIGLPREQYKPRPSRSRAKLVSEEQTLQSCFAPSEPTRASAHETQSPDAGSGGPLKEPDETPLTKLKKDKRKKNKMKRAKTSAAALLKKSDKMISDGEDDVVWVDSKPATVKMKIPDPVNSKAEEEDDVQREPSASLGQGGQQAADSGPVTVEQQSVVEEKSEKAGKISVDVPVPLEGDDHPPKKRGRKKKNGGTEHVHVDEDVEPSVAAAELDNGLASDRRQDTASTAVHQKSDPQPEPEPGLGSLAREPLKEKVVNISHHQNNHHQQCNGESTVPTTSTPSPTEPTIAAPPISPPLPPTTPHVKTTTDTSSEVTTVEKGPTKHSPINPTGGTVKYRVGLSRRAAIPPLLKIVRK